MKPHGTKRLRLKCDILLSTSAFKCNLRRHIWALADDLRESSIVLTRAAAADWGVSGRGLHSSTFELNLSRFLPLTPPTDTDYPKKRAYVEPISGRV
jgi:hypothetical protein